MIFRQSIVSCGLMCAMSVTASAQQTRESGSAMNVVFILIDDLGWSDLGCYGSDFYQTPHIDRLAASSLKFNAAYAAAPVCSPTRAAILTGKSPARLDMTIWHEGAVAGGPQGRRLRDAEAVANLPREETTLAELFREQGYYTAHVGKWHLGTAAYYPETQGFDLNVGGTFWGAPSTFFFPFSGRWNNQGTEFRYVPGLGPGVAGDYLPDRLTDVALEVIETQQSGPFFLSLWYHTVHSPIEAPQRLVEHFRNLPAGKYHKQPNYAAMVNRMDHNVGRVLHKLDELELSDQTIVIFTSDNGGVDFEQRSIVPTSNFPLRSGKGTLYEGGLRVPLLVRWPGKRSGETNELSISQDFYPTLAALLGNEDASAGGGQLDGVNLLPLLSDPKSALPSRTLYWHFPHYYARMSPGSALRSDNWKLIHYYEDDRLELYDLRSDLGERHNIAAANAARAERLKAKLDAWRHAVKANAPTPGS